MPVINQEQLELTPELADMRIRRKRRTVVGGVVGGTVGLVVLGPIGGIIGGVASALVTRRVNKSKERALQEEMRQHETPSVYKTEPEILHAAVTE